MGREPDPDTYGSERAPVDSRRVAAQLDRLRTLIGGGAMALVYMDRSPGPGLEDVAILTGATPAITAWLLARAATRNADRLVALEMQARGLEPPSGEDLPPKPPSGLVLP